MNARDQLTDLAARLAGSNVPGGCEDCAAYQTMTDHGDGVFRVTVHHDDTCPWLNRRTT